jgi:hypothetical protein
MTKLKAALLAFVILFVGFSSWFFSETPPWELTRVLTAMRAKEYCTCHFLLKKDHDYCLTKISKGYPFIGEQEISEEKRFVRFAALGYSNTATYVNSRLGCLLSQ